jgi:hypothetical protein
MRAWLEERRGVVEGLRLDVLGQSEERRSAAGGIEHRRHRLREGLQDLCGVGDAIPVSGDRAERVVDRGGRVVEMLHLLQHGVGDPPGERVPGQEEQG